MFYNIFGAPVASWPTLKCGAHSRKKIYFIQRHTEQKYAIWFRLCYLYGQKVR